MPKRRFLLRVLVTASLLLAGISHQTLAAAKPELLVAISLDMPPYVMDKAGTGLEVDIVRQALKDYSLLFIQVPYGELQTAVQQKGVDVSLGVGEEDKGIYCSADFITFANFAISRKADRFRIDSVADLKNHRVLTWGGAYLALGPEFEALFSPQSPQRKNYIEVADQEEQVRQFWKRKGQVIIIDRSIFNYFSKKMGHDPGKTSFHAIFPPVTNFKAGFRDATVRDRFDEGLADLCRSGEYAKLLRHYDVTVKQEICK